MILSMSQFVVGCFESILILSTASHIFTGWTFADDDLERVLGYNEKNFKKACGDIVTCSGTNVTLSR